MLKCKDCKKEYQDHKELMPVHNIDTDDFYYICRTCVASASEKGIKNRNSYDATMKSLKRRRRHR
ncbi:MAG TPA: hypothetical protein DCP90_02040 [Clostridiales bacterium]|nr:MAG: hypothetical protein A2Y22_08620 [Clostridiales bacterium GWD2_32_59]HAN09374.1 hypothetical protein [Clostridiales bacterium]